MNTYKAKLIQMIKRTPTIESFRFLPSEKINFLPGQFLKIIFDETNPKNQLMNKYLSFSSSPVNDYFEVTKRLNGSVFSESLKNLKIGGQILIEAPLGSCFLEAEDKKIVFLTGGIGITPVISILEDVNYKKLDNNIMLFYSNNTEEEIAFKKELDYWKSRNVNLNIFYTITECVPKDENCIFGRIDKELLLDKVKDVNERTFFIFGPPKMVSAMSNLCVELGCDKKSIKTESFVGY